MKTWNQAPIVRLLIPFIAGIVVAIHLPLQLTYIFLFVFALLLIVTAVVFIPGLYISYKKSWWFGLLINVTLFTSAYHLAILKTEKFNTNHFSKLTDANSFAYIRLTESYLEKEKTLKVIVEVIAVKQGDKWSPTSGKAMLYIEKNTRSLHLNYGDELLIKTNFKEVPLPQNPGESDYKSFLAFHNIYHQAYLKDRDWVYSGYNNSLPIINYCVDLRSNLLNILTANHIKGDEFSVGAALLLGYEDRLDADIISAYASTGTLHVLSVSGLHVAIVYIVFSWLLFFFDKIKYGNIIKATLLISFLWFYAALTGLSPSVLRAAAMFSFIVIAKAFNRYTNIYNTLAASAFLLLLFDPYLITDVGFQLSYIAVIGIVYIQPKIYDWFEINNRLLDETWKITTVSLAAQIATFPLGLFYFHQFPNYFLLSNFIVIPISTLVIYLGIALFTLAKISIAALYLSLSFNWSTWFLNKSVKTIEQWPCALLQGISITAFETFLIYGLVILFFYYFNKRKFNYLISAFCIALIILFSQLLEQYQQFKQKAIVVYNIPKTGAIDFISAKNNVLYTDSSFAKNERSQLLHIKHNWWNLGINNTKIISDSVQTKTLIIKNNSIQFYDKTLAIINNNTITKGEAVHLQPIPMDYIIISKNPEVQIPDILKIYTTEKIIFDSSNTMYRIKKWEKECKELGLEYYSVLEKGALVVCL